MPHNITELYQTKVVPRLYQQYFQGAFTSFMENNAIGVEYTGGKYVTMSEMSVDGLGNYDRNLGFVRGNVTGSKKQYEMTMDRGREFLIDVADSDETGFLMNAGSVMSVFQNEHVIPEIDADTYVCLRNDANVYKIVMQTLTHTVLRPVAADGTFASESVKCISNSMLNMKGAGPASIEEAIAKRFNGEYVVPVDAE